MKKPFINPYSGVEKGSTRRLSFDPTIADYSFIQQIRPGSGTMSTVASKLWKALVNELQRANITSVADLDAFEDFLNNIRVIGVGRGFLNSPAGGDMPKSTSPDVRSGAKRARGGTT